MLKYLFHQESFCSKLNLNVFSDGLNLKLFIFDVPTFSFNISGASSYFASSVNSKLNLKSFVLDNCALFLMNTEDLFGLVLNLICWVTENINKS